MSAFDLRQPRLQAGHGDLERSFDPEYRGGVVASRALAYKKMILKPQ
jgi:hypothetical protein